MNRITADMTPSQKRSFFLCLLMMFMFAGVVAGTLLFIRDSGGKYTESVFMNQLLVITSAEDGVVTIFVKRFLPVFVILITQMVCGFFAIGQPLSVFTLFQRGIAGGISAAAMYSQYGLRGFFIILVLLVPTLLCDMYILSLGARESLRLSNIIIGFVLGKNTEGAFELKLYAIKFLVLIGLAIAASSAATAVTYFFAGFLMKT